MLACMILDYRDKHTKQFAEGEFVRRFQGFDRQASKRLEILNAATSLRECLAGLPSNRLEALGGDRAGQIPSASTSNGGFRFQRPVDAAGPSKAEIVDYH